MERRKISVILPVYNGAKYVGKAIESVLNQTYENIELIIVNDCSQDNTMDIISEYANRDNRVKIFNNEINQKLPRTLNIGFAAATGDYFTWTSDDNRYHVDALERMADILNSMPEIGLVYADFSIVDMDGNLIKEVKEGEPEEIKYRDNIGACFLYRRSLADKVGIYNPEAFLAEDYEYFIRCYKEAKGKFFHISEDMYDYGRHEANLSSTREKDIAHKAFEVKNMHFDFLYSLCDTPDERTLFFDELLFLLRDAKEKEAQRQRFYSLDQHFAQIDKKRVKKQRIKRMVTLPMRVAIKLKVSLFGIAF